MSGTGNESTMISALRFSEEELNRVDNDSDEMGLLGIVIPTYQSAVETLLPENWEGDASDSIGHWWRKIGHEFGERPEISAQEFWKEFEDNKTTLSIEEAIQIAQETKQYLSGLLQEILAGNESPGRGSRLDAIYNPSLDELSFLAGM